MGIKIYNKLPLHIKQESHNPRKFKTYLKHIHCFYSEEEYFQYRAQKVKYQSSKYPSYIF
jgi:hypothetical protein